MLSPINEGFSDGLFIEIVFDVIVLEDFVRHALKVVGQWLQRTLEEVLVVGGVLFEFTAGWLFALEFADVAELRCGVFEGGLAVALWLLLFLLLLALGGFGWCGEDGCIA